MTRRPSEGREATPASHGSWTLSLFHFVHDVAGIVFEIIAHGNVYPQQHRRVMEELGADSSHRNHREPCSRLTRSMMLSLFSFTNFVKIHVNLCVNCVTGSMKGHGRSMIDLIWTFPGCGCIGVAMCGLYLQAAVQFIKVLNRLTKSSVTVLSLVPHCESVTVSDWFVYNF